MRSRIATALLLSIFLASQAQALVLWEVESQYFSAVFQTEGSYKYAPQGITSYKDTEILSFYVTKSFNEKYMPLGDWDVTGQLSFVFGESITNNEFFSRWDLPTDEPFAWNFGIGGKRIVDLFTNSQGNVLTAEARWGIFRADVQPTARTNGNLSDLESCENDLRYFDANAIDITECNFIAGGAPSINIQYVRDQKDWRKVDVSEPPMLPILIAVLAVLAFLRLKKKAELSNFTAKRI